MAYDPYDRGDNPWIANLDMPRSNPTAKPGASRAASLTPAKKKKPVDPELLDPSLRWQSGKITRDPTTTGTVPLPPRRPPATGNPVRPNADIGVPLPPRRPFELTPGAQPMEQAPDAPMPPRRPMDVGETQGPPIPGGLLAGPSPGAMRPERSTPLVDTVPTGAPPGGPVVNTAPPTGAPTPMMDPGFLNFLRSQLFNQGKPVT